MQFISVIIFLIMLIHNQIFAKIEQVEFRVQTLNYHNPEYIDTNPYHITTRFRPTLFFNKKLENIDETNLTFTPIWGRYWGNNQTVNSGQRPSEDDNQWGLAQLSLVMNKNNFTGSIGRQPIHYREGIIFGQNEPNLFPTSHDSIAFSYKKLDFLYIHDQINNKSYNNRSTNKTFAFYSQLDWIDFFSYYYKDNTLETKFFHPPNNPEDYLLLGSRIAPKWENGHMIGHLVFVRVPVNHFTKKRDIDLMVDLSLLQSISISNHDITLKGNIFYGGPSYQNRYGDYYSFLNSINLFSRRNLSGVSMVIGYDFFDKKLKTKGSIYQFFRSNRVNTIYKNDGRPYDYNQASTQKNIGNELNIDIQYQLLNNISLELDSGVFIPKKYMTEQFSSKNHYLTKLTLLSIF